MIGTVLQQVTQQLDITELAKSYGWFFAILLYLTQSIVPWLRDTFSESHKARLAQEAEDRKQEREQKQQTARLLERVGDQLHTTTLAMTVLTERVTTVERSYDRLGEKMGDSLEHIDKYLSILVDRQQRDKEQATAQQRTVGRQPPK